MSRYSLLVKTFTARLNDLVGQVCYYSKTYVIQTSLVKYFITTVAHNSF